LFNIHFSAHLKNPQVKDLQKLIKNTWFPIPERIIADMLRQKVLNLKTSSSEQQSPSELQTAATAFCESLKEDQQFLTAEGAFSEILDTQMNAYHDAENNPAVKLRSQKREDDLKSQMSRHRVLNSLLHTGSIMLFFALTGAAIYAGATGAGALVLLLVVAFACMSIVVSEREEEEHLDQDKCNERNCNTLRTKQDVIQQFIQNLSPPVESTNTSTSSYDTQDNESFCPIFSSLFARLPSPPSAVVKPLNSINAVL